MTNESENSSNRDKPDKKNWFQSLSRRRKSSLTPQKHQNNDHSASNGAASTAAASAVLETAAPTTSAESSNNNERKRKNIFQRLKKRMGIHFSMRQRKPGIESTSSSNFNHTNADAVVCYPNDLPSFSMNLPKMTPFSHDFRRFVTKKWLEDVSQPNRVMYTACLEMLSQVWYWGEISRRDAQGQLKDKPIGSFLVRDSETGGSATCWYTLSFRIQNCTFHSRLEHRDNYWHFEQWKYESIVEMIEDILNRCTRDPFVCYVRVPNELQPPLPVVLKYPISRYSKILTLQDLCRRVIQRHVAPDKIGKLQIPSSFQQYLVSVPINMTNESENSSNRDKPDKKNWFQSLSRRRKSSITSQKHRNNDHSASTGAASAAVAPAALATAAATTSAESSSNLGGGKERKRKDDRKNIFQRFKKRMGIHFSMRQKKLSIESTSSSNFNHPHGDAVVCYPNDLPSFSMNPPEMTPFSYDFRRFVTKKWLEDASLPNRVMYTACSEMLSQVWYWGEISRRDAQAQLKDKPIGSFLVRDSETGGSATCWYTLSFRIQNCTLHYRLEHRANYWHFEQLQYESIVEMIEDILNRCTRDPFVCYVRVPNVLQPPLPVVLKYPISRYNKIMTLKDLCGRVIQRHVGPDKIGELQIPSSLQQYLADIRGLVFQSS